MKRNNIPGYYFTKNTYRQLLDTYINVRLSIDPKNNYLIFSDPRGGSTWLTEILHQVTVAPILWEPLHLKKGGILQEMGFGWRQYIPEDANWPEAQQFFKKLFEGKIRNKGILKATNTSEILNTDRFIIKFCRANMLLPYLTNNFQLNYKPVYLIRHPFAVVSSQLKHGSWKHPYKSFDIPKTPYSYIYQYHEKFLSSLKTKEEALTATWCLTNQVPLTHSKNNIDWITINYETLLLNPETTLKRILTEWGINYNVNNIDFKKKSLTTKTGSPISGRAQLEYWKNNLTSQQIERMERVLEYFKVKDYNRSAEPQVIY